MYNKILSSLGNKIQLDQIKILNGLILSKYNNANQELIKQNLILAEFKIFSQFGDDGIIQFLVDYIKPIPIFVEIGVADFFESNTRFLLMSKNWKGYCVDGSKRNIAKLKKSYFYWQYDLNAFNFWITKENINSILENDMEVEKEIGLLHIDLDGNDYWVWKEIVSLKPQILILEYNSIFQLNPWVVPYDQNFYRTNYHYSNLYWGASLKSLIDLCEEKGYLFVGCNSAGNNSYYVQKEYINGLKIENLQEGYVESKYRESRDKKGNLTFVSGKNRLKQIKGLKVFNTVENKIEII